MENSWRMQKSLKSKKILVVDDEQAVAKALELKLTSVGFDVKTVYDSTEAFALLEKEKFHLILLDLMMPVLDGFAFLSELKVRKIHIPVIVTSNLGQEEDLKRAKALGAKDYFVKSNTPIAEVVDHVKNVLTA